MADPNQARVGPAPWDRRELPGAFDVEESARRLGHYAWLEERLFEVLGTWVAEVPEVPVKLRLGAHSYHHAWHAQLWRERLPVLGGQDPAHLVVAPNDAMVDVVAALRAPTAPEETLEKLVGVYRVVLPHTIAAYSSHLAATSPIADAAVVRWLRFVLDDEQSDWREGELLIQSLLAGPAEVDRAAARQAEVERLLVAAGGIAGPGTLGDT